LIIIILTVLQNANFSVFLRGSERRAQNKVIFFFPEIKACMSEFLSAISY